MKKYSNKGFTLIELLIVIIIIAILAAVLIAVINPTTVQNRAKDAGIRANLNKLGLAINSFYSAYGRYPTSTELPTLLTGVATGASGSGTAASPYKFKLTGVSLPASTFFEYVVDNSVSPPQFDISASTFTNTTYFVLTETVQGVYVCSGKTYVQADCTLSTE